MNILMIYPEMPKTIGKFDDLVKLSGKKASFPPIALLTIASMLPNVWNIKLIDLNVKNEFISELSWADYVFISAMNVQSISTKYIINTCKEHNVKVVAGGPLFTHEYEKFPNVDHFVLNEAEITLPEFLNDLMNNQLKKIYRTEKFADVLTTPQPNWDLLNLNDYLYSLIQFSRGCPYLCEFCDVTTLYGRVPRTKTTEQIINELDLLISKGKNEMIFFADDNLIGNKNVLKKDLLPALINWRKNNLYAPAFATQLTITLADDEELMRMLYEAGFRHIIIGIETIDQEALVKMRKKQNTKRDLLENVQLLQSKGFLIIGTFIVGLDTDTEKVFDNLIKFIQESGIIFVVVNVLKAPPGTELYERMKRENRLLTEFEFGENKTNIIPIMDADTLHKGYKKVLSEVYNPQNVYERIVTNLDNLDPFKIQMYIRRKVSYREFLTFTKIIFTLGVVYKGRKYFWKSFLHTIFYKRQYLDLTILFCMLMYQYSNLLDSFLENEKKGILIYSKGNLETAKAS